MEAKDFINTRYEKLANEIERIEKERDFDKALAMAKRYVRLAILEKYGIATDETDDDFIHWLNPYER